MEPYTWTLHEARAKLDAGDISAVELTASLLYRIEQVEPQVLAYNCVAPELVEAQAEAADHLIHDGKAGPLTGLGIALKDNMITQDLPTTCSARLLEGFVSPTDGTIAAKLKEAGSVVMGKTNMDEFAMGSSTENSATEATRNPWDLNRAPGGSSGGSAAAVAADLCLAALGSDTGGSIRQPASLCGVVGMKPTYGRVSRYGLVAFASSLDQIGPLTKDVEDAALLLNAVSGNDPLDSTSSKREAPDFMDGLKDGVAGMRIGVPKEYFIDGTDPAVLTAVQSAIQQMTKLGAEIVEISLPHTPYAVSTYYLIATAEASSNLARFDGVRYGNRVDNGGDLLAMYMATREAGFGPEVKRRIMLGTYALSAGYYDAYYKKAQQVRSLIAQDLTEAFEQVDVLLTPTSPTGAFKLGERTADPLKMYLSDIYTISANLAGVPAISQPCGLDGNGVPIGLQFIGRSFDEASVLKAAWAFENATDFHTARPAL